LETFEFIVEGPAVSLKAKKTNAKRYQKWIRTVRTAAQKYWLSSMNPTNSPAVIVHIINYYTSAPPDVDNIIKPILDAIETVAYSDDRQVFKVISEKFDLSNIQRIQSPSPFLAAGLEKYNELLHIIVTWDTED
jgi:Holliday junction resolvase RusA-like endonuclease